MTAIFKTRHPLLVLIWSLGILIVINLPQYLAAAAGAMMGGLTFDAVMSGKGLNPLSYLGQGLTAALIGIPFAYLVIVLLWKRPLSWMRLNFNYRLMFGGLLLGLALPLAVLAIILAIGNVKVIADPSRLSAGDFAMILAGALGWAIFIAFSEEVVYRGIIVREWASRGGWVAAALAGGLWFGALHLPSLGSRLTLISTAWILIAGVAVTVLFVALYVRSRSLWLPIGFHAGWNLCLQGILGVITSGKEAGPALFLTAVPGPDWLTGGAFGLEASAIAIAVYLLAALIVLRWKRPLELRSLNPRPDDILTESPTV